jgi:hypothetical protein|tara:strand:- start:2424 stop:3290 length:867 start_codon:yes stop_codon:yes gene_type:complete
MPLLPINKPESISASRIAVQQIDIHTNALSGDVIDGGTITNFTSTGIKDISGSVNLTIKNDTVEVAKDLHVKGTIKVENLEYVQAQVPKLNVQKAIMVDHNEVLWKEELGKSVKKSHLTEVGVLKNLQVRNALYVADGRVGVNTTSPSADFSVNVGGYEVITKMHESNAFVGTHTHVAFAIGTDDTARLTCRANGDVVVGSETGKPVNLNVYGKIGIGVKNPAETLEVAGNIKFSERVFTSGEQSPRSGSWNTGSIMWNEKPDVLQPVGWVCIKGGKPGSWRPFGTIS